MKTRSVPVRVLVLGGLYLAFRTYSPRFLAPGLPHDDGWYLKRAIEIVGRRKEHYDGFSAIKTDGYAWYLALGRVLRIPISTLDGVLTMIAAAVMFRAVGRLTSSRARSMGAAAAVLFSPAFMSLTGSRYYRDSITPTLVVLVVGLAILCWRPDRLTNTIGAAPPFFLVSGLFFFVREDSIWLAPLLGCIFLIVLAQQSGYVRKIVVGVLCLGSFAIFPLIQVRSDYAQTHSWSLTSQTDPLFLAADAALYSLRDEPAKYQVFSAGRRTEILGSGGPAVARLFANGQRWQDAICTAGQFEGQRCVTVPAAWWPWALRDAVAASSPAVTHANLRELTRELRTLCRTMSCKRTLIPFWMGIGLHDLKNTANSFRHVASAALSPGIPYLGPTVVIGTGPVGDIPAFEDVPLIELSGWVVSSDGRVAVSAVADTGATLDSFESMASPDVWAALRRSSALPARFRLRAAGCVSPCQFSLRDATGSVVGVITASNRGAGLAPGPQGSIDSLTVTRPKTISPPRWVFQWLVKFSAISALIGVVTIVTGLRKGTLLLFIGIGGAVLLRLLMMSYIDASLAPARQHQYVYPLGAMLAPLGFAAFGLTANDRERAFVRSLMTRMPGRIRSLAGRGAMMVESLLGLSSRSAKTGPDLAMTVSAAATGPRARPKAQLFAWRHERELVTHLTLRELRSKYKRTTLGWAWSMLNPLISALIFSVVFGVFFHVSAPVGNPSGLKNFTFFLLAAMLPWNMNASGILGAMGNLLGNAGLITKVRFRRETIVIATVISFAVTMAIELSVLMLGEWVIGHRLAFKYIPALLGLIVLQAVFVMGCGLLLSSLNVFLRDLQYLANLGLMAWMYLTPVVYPITFVPKTGRIFGVRLPVRFLVRLNPMSRFVGAYRDCLYNLRWPSLVTWGSCATAAVLLYVVGMTTFNRLQGRFAEEI